IVNAVKKIPDEWYELEGKKLVDMIKSRRDKLKEASDEFYELINETVDVYGSDKAEQIEINILTDNELEVALYDLNKEGFKKDQPFFVRNFNKDDTKEIRIYTNGGDDKIYVDGSLALPLELPYEPPVTSIDVKIIKGTGKKIIKDRSDKIFNVIKDKRSKNNEFDRFEPKTEDRSYDWRFGPGFGYNSDDGIIIGGGPILYKYGLGAKPYVYRMSLIGSYAFGAKSYEVKYAGEFYSLIKGAKVSLDLGKTELDITRFYGLGNETIFDKDLDSKDFYKTGQELINISPAIEFSMNKKFSFSISPFYKYSDVSYDQNTFLGQSRQIYGTGIQKFIGINSAIKFDTRDNAAETNKGFYAGLFGNYTPDILKNNSSFGKAGFDLRAYISSDTVKGVTLALRTSGGKVWGKHPFYESLFLGGINSLKGFSRERFAGDGLLLGQAELRIRLFRVNLLIPGLLGISAFGGTGRVFVKGEDSKRWHSSYGGSIWITYLNRMFNVGVTVAKSDEGFKYFFGTALFL
ncbi:MAG: BamA/TamA family outer membrane protein, partial [Ignavibacteria bacterium]